MYATEYLNKDFLVGKINQNPESLLILMKDQKLTHLPLFDGLTYIGNIAIDDVEDNDLSTKEDYLDFTEKFYTTADNTILEVIKIMYRYQSNMMPVFDKEEKYLGTILQEDILNYFATTPFIDDAGAEMLLSVPTVELSMTAVANIVESHNSKLLGSFLIDQNEDRTKLLIKVRSENILSIGETLERYGYQVIQKFYNDEKSELLSERYNQLLKYINS